MWPPHGEKGLATRAKGREGGSMIVGRPAAEVGPFDRLKLCVGNRQGIRTGTMCHPASARQPSRCNDKRPKRPENLHLRPIDTQQHADPTSRVTESVYWVWMRERYCPLVGRDGPWKTSGADSPRQGRA